jgi:hypothetical protein
MISQLHKHNQINIKHPTIWSAIVDQTQSNGMQLHKHHELHAELVIAN